MQVKLTTNFGDITLELFEDKAPKTVANFVSYVEDGFYDNTIFHRVINGFMIQGGGVTADMEQKDTKATIENEANNGVANEVGTIAMARTQDPHSATAQFFINVGNNTFLNHTSESVNGCPVVDLRERVRSGSGAQRARARTWLRKVNFDDEVVVSGVGKLA